MMIYGSRREAGQKLASALQPYGLQGGLVIAQPPGGALVAEPIAEAFGMGLDVMVTRKLKVVGEDGIYYGALGPNGVRIVDRETMAEFGIAEAELTQATAWEMNELHRRLHRYRQDLPPPNVDGKTVVYVDEGLDSGLSALAAVHAVKKLNPARILIAAPISSPEAEALLTPVVDVFISLLTPDDFHHVAAAYRTHALVNDQEVIDLLHRHLPV